MLNFAIPRIACRLLSLAVCLGMASGCSTWDLKKASFWPLGGDKPGTPDKIVAIWTDTVLYKSNQTPGRGFGGRLMFYQGKNEQPIKVDGSIVVYAFDETNRAPGNSRPDRKYVFTPDQIPSHYSKSKIGHSYSLWLPWDEVGGPQKEITLVVRFEPKGEAGVVMGEPSRQLLPGMTTGAAQEASKLPAQGATAGMPPPQSANQPVQQASYNAAPASGDRARRSRCPGAANDDHYDCGSVRDGAQPAFHQWGGFFRDADWASAAAGDFQRAATALAAAKQ